MKYLLPKKGSLLVYLPWTFVMLFLSLFIVFPLLCTVLSPDRKDFAAVFSSAVWQRTLFNTFAACLCSSFFSVLTGYIFAYSVVRGGIPFRKFFAVLPVVHLMTPPFVGGLSFILLAGRNGFITHTVLGLDVSLYGFTGLVIAQTLCFFPIAYLICAQVLDGINPALEQAASGMGAGRLKVFLTVTLPLSMPGLLSSFLFIAVSVLSDFGNPMIVAGRFRVLAVEIYTQLTGWLNPGVSAVLGLVLLVPSVAVFLLYNRISKKNSIKTAGIGGKISFSSEMRSSSSSVFFTVFCFSVSSVVIAQFAAVFAGAFQKLWGIDISFTFEHIKSVPLYFNALGNSLCFSFSAALISVFIAFCGAYIVQRTSLPCKRFIDVAIQLASAVSGSLFGLSFSLAGARTGFRSSAVMIVAAMVVGFLPFSYRIIMARFVQIKPEVDDASFSLGAGRITTAVRILAPLSSGGLFYSFLYSFVRSVGTVSAVIFLVSFDTPLASIKILNLAEQGNWGKSCAMAVVLTLITFAVLFVGKLILGVVSWSRKNHLWK